MMETTRRQDPFYEAARVFSGDVINHTLPLQPLSLQRDITEKWNQVIEAFPDLSEPIRGFLRKMEIVDKTQEALPTIITFLFKDLKREQSKHLLGKILFSRILTPEGRINKKVNPKKEAKKMSKELFGIPNAWDTDQGKGVEEEYVMKAVLTGELKI